MRIYPASKIIKVIAITHRRLLKWQSLGMIVPIYSEETGWGYDYDEVLALNQRVTGKGLRCDLPERKRAAILTPKLPTVKLCPRTPEGLINVKDAMALTGMDRKRFYAFVRDKKMKVYKKGIYSYFQLNQVKNIPFHERKYKTKSN